MIRNFSSRSTEELWETNSSKSFPREIWVRAKALLTIMFNTSTLDDLKIKGQPPNIRLHKLKGNRKLEWSITISLPITEANYDKESKTNASWASSC